MQRKICPVCGTYNPPHAVRCRSCGQHFSNAMLTNSTSVVSNQPGTIVGRSDIGASLGYELAEMYWQLYQAAEASNRDDPVWEVVGKHLEAHRLHQKVQQFRHRLEDLVLLKHEAILSQAMDALRDREALVQEDEQARLRLGLQLNRLGAAIQAMERIDLGTTLPDDVKAEMAHDIWLRVLDQIFAPPNPPAPPPPHNSLNGGFHD